MTLFQLVMGALEQLVIGCGQMMCSVLYVSVEWSVARQVR